MNVQHRKNRDVLVKAGFTITNYVNSTHVWILEAHHKDGRKVAIRV